MYNGVEGAVVRPLEFALEQAEKWKVGKKEKGGGGCPFGFTSKNSKGGCPVSGRGEAQGNDEVQRGAK